MALEYFKDGKYQDIDKAQYYMLEADFVDPLAQLYLGLSYYWGNYFPQDSLKSWEHIKNSAQNGYSEGLFFLSYIYSEKISFYEKYIFPLFSYEEGRNCLKESAKKNHPFANFILSSLCKSNDDYYLKQDVDYLITSLKNGYSHASYLLGLLYEDGRYMPQDYTRAFDFFTTAAKSNIPIAKFKLAKFYYMGLDIEKNITKAIELYKEAALLGITEAYYYLGIIYATEIDVLDYEQAISFFLKASDKISDCDYLLGVLYLEGRDKTVDKEKAFKHFKIAASKNHPQAAYNLALLYKELNEKMDDLTFYYNYLYIAAEWGLIEPKFLILEKKNNFSKYYLGLLCTNEEEILNEGIENGFIPAFYIKGKKVFEHINFSIINEEHEKAFIYLKHAYDNGCTDALFYLGCCYFYGMGTLKDENKGKEYVLQSILNGDQEAFRLCKFYFYSREGSIIDIPSKLPKKKKLSKNFYPYYSFIFNDIDKTISFKYSEFPYTFDELVQMKLKNLDY